MFNIINGNSAEILKQYADNTFDAIVTDPPYGINFLGKDWDADTGGLEIYQQCLRVLKPGGHILAFSAARTYHHLAITLEKAGFEIRDQLMWIYASGFPKSQDIGKSIDRANGKSKKYTYCKSKSDTRTVKNTGNHSTPYCIECDAPMTYPPQQCDRLCNAKQPPVDNEWSGWGTALKPAHEPIALARKPFKGSIKDNVQKHGTGALNIDATRISLEDEKPFKGKMGNSDPRNNLRVIGVDNASNNSIPWEGSNLGRFPSNVLGDLGDYQKFFYCPKVSRKERHLGFDGQLPSQKSMLEEMGGYYVNNDGGNSMIYLPHLGNIYIHGLKHEYELWCKKNNKSPLIELPKRICDTSTNKEEFDNLGPNRIHLDKKQVGNNHPTVKPIALMEYLIKLITPPGGHVLDPFNGSGSTGCAAVGLGFDYTGIELDPNYVSISNKRINAWIATETTEAKTPNNNFDKLFEETIPPDENDDK